MNDIREPDRIACFGIGNLCFPIGCCDSELASGDCIHSMIWMGMHADAVSGCKRYPQHPHPLLHGCQTQPLFPGSPGEDLVDIEPLASLYKNQVFQLGRHLGVPKEIIDRTPSPDTYSYVVSDQELYFCIPYDMIDLILYAIEHNLPKEEAAMSLGIKMEQLNRAWRDIERKREASEPLRNLPPTPPMKFR